jgi:hypothetical protein
MVRGTRMGEPDNQQGHRDSREQGEREFHTVNAAGESRIRFMVHASRSDEASFADPSCAFRPWTRS